MASSSVTSIGSSLSQGISMAMESSSASAASAVTMANNVVEAQGSSWLGLFGRLVLFVLQIVSSILYFVLKLATFSLPSLLYTFFSTTLTFTLNATTL